MFGVITLLVSDYLISCKFNTFLSNYRFILYFDNCSFTGVDSVILQVTSLLYIHGFIMMSSLFNAVSSSFYARKSVFCLPACK